ncbi:DUF3488 and transglutaminase-like domain-containing protein [Streptomyces coffeae]|nr:transglutaminase domain-containing protein [Streptomyces coffeae]
MTPSPYTSARLPVTATAPASAVLAAAVAGSAFHPVFGYRPLLLPVAVAAILPVLLATVCARRARPLPPELALCASVVLWLAACAITVYDVRTPGDIGTGLRRVAEETPSGWGRLLDAPLPAPAEAPLVAVVFTLTWAAAAAGAELALRTRGRARCLAPALALFVAATATTIGGPGTTLPQAVAMAVVSGAVLAVGHQPEVRLGSSPDRATGPATTRRRPAPVARALLWPSLIAALAVPSAAALPWTPGGAPYNPREHRTERTAPVHLTHPLEQFSGWRSSPRQVLFTVRGSAVGRWRLTALTAYDGAQWKPSGLFTRHLGTDLKPGTETGRPTHSEVTVKGLTGRLLPVPETPLRAGAPVAVNAEDGAVLADDPLARGVRYRVTSVTPHHPAPLDAARLRAAPGAATTLAVPSEAPKALTVLAHRARVASRSPYGRATALAAMLRKEYTCLPKAPGNQSLGALDRFLTERQGAPVDFASAFALAARVTGLPTRIVVGFQVTRRGSGDLRVTGADARVWNEIALAGAGWVPVDPVPPPGRERHTPPSAEPTPAPSPSAEPRPSHHPTPAPPARGAAPRPSVGPATDMDWVLVALWGVSIAAVAALLLRGWLLLIRPWLRIRRGRTAPVPARRATAAWQAVVEQATVADTSDPPPSATYHDIATHLAATGGPGTRAAAAPLALLAARARFCEPTAEEAAREPAWRPMPAQDADRAWLHSDVIRAELKAHQGWRARGWARLLLPRRIRRLSTGHSSGRDGSGSLRRDGGGSSRRGDGSGDD